MIGRGEFTDTAWATVVPPLLPPPPMCGQQRDHRQVLNGILWKLRTGAPWRDLPARYGPWRTVYARFVRWQRDGTWDRFLAHVQSTSETMGEVVWEVSIDSSVVRAHQHAAGARKKGAVRTRPLRRSATAGAG